MLPETRKRLGEALGVLTVLLMTGLIFVACSGQSTANTPTSQAKKETSAPSQETKPVSKEATGKETGEPKQANAPASKSDATDADLEFYKGKTVTYIVATKPGGGYDAYARLSAAYIQKNLPGSTVIVKNVDGAGHIIGANEIYASRPDGLTFGIFNKGLIFAQLANQEGIKFDLRKFSWVANVASEPLVFIVNADSPYKTIQDVMKSGNTLKLAAAGVGSSAYANALLMSKSLGFPVKMIVGYQGSEADLAMLRGEVDGQVGAYDNMEPMLDRGEARPLLTMGKNRLKELPDIPLASELAPPQMKGVIDLMSAMADLGRPIAAPPGIPDGRLKVLRGAVEKAFKDPALLADAEKAQLPILYMSGETATERFTAALDNQPPEVLEIVKELAQPSK